MKTKQNLWINILNSWYASYYTQIYLNLYKSISSINIKYNIFLNLKNYGKVAVLGLFSNLKRNRRFNIKPNNSFLLCRWPTKCFLKELSFVFFTLNQNVTGKILKSKWRCSINTSNIFREFPFVDKILRVQHTHKKNILNFSLEKIFIIFPQSTFKLFLKMARWNFCKQKCLSNFVTFC